MSDWFAAKRAKILQQLSIPYEYYKDASPKGSVDEPIRDLIKIINEQSALITTSSCSGRLAVYLDGISKSAEAARVEGKGQQADSGGKGGGRWLFTSHHVVDPADLVAESTFLSALGLANESPSQPESETAVALVHLKFEPMILHILCATREAAQRTLSAALDAGFRESGISGTITDTAQKPVAPMVAVRSSGLALDSIIGFYDPDKDSITPMVSEDYLRVLLRVANGRFIANAGRRDRFAANLMARMNVADPCTEVRTVKFTVSHPSN